jgi:hypothetical protein
LADNLHISFWDLLGAYLALRRPAKANDAAKSGEEYWTDQGKLRELAWSLFQSSRFRSWLYAQRLRDSLHAEERTRQSTSLVLLDEQSIMDGLADDDGAGMLRSIALPIESKLDPRLSTEQGMNAVTAGKDVAVGTEDGREKQAKAAKDEARDKRNKELRDAISDPEAEILKLVDIKDDTFARFVSAALGVGTHTGRGSITPGLWFRYHANVHPKKESPGLDGSYDLDVNVFLPIIEWDTESDRLALSFEPKEAALTMVIGLRRVGGQPLTGEEMKDGGHSGVRTLITVKGGATTTKHWLRRSRPGSAVPHGKELPWVPAKSDECVDVLNALLELKPIGYLLSAPVAASFKVENEKGLPWGELIGLAVPGVGLLGAAGIYMAVKGAPDFKKDLADGLGYQKSTAIYQVYDQFLALKDMKGLKPDDVDKLHAQSLSYVRRQFAAGQGTTVEKILEKAGFLRTKPKKALDPKGLDIPKLMAEAGEIVNGIPVKMKVIGSGEHQGGVLVSLAHTSPAPLEHRFGLRVSARNAEVAGGGDSFVTALQLDWLRGDTQDDHWLARVWPARKDLRAAPSQPGFALFPLRYSAQNGWGFGLAGDLASFGADFYRHAPGGAEANKAPEAMPGTFGQAHQPKVAAKAGKIAAPLLELGPLKIQRMSVRIAAGGALETEGGARNGDMYFGGALMFDGVRIGEDDPEEKLTNNALSLGFLLHVPGEPAPGSTAPRAPISMIFDPDTWVNGKRGEVVYLGGPISLGRLLGAAKPPAEGGTWEKVTKVLDAARVENLGIKLNGFIDPTKRKPDDPVMEGGLYASVSLNFGGYLSLAARGMRLVGFTSKTRFELPFDRSGVSLLGPLVEQVALAITLPKKLKLLAAASWKTSFVDRVSKITVLGVGKVEVLEKLALTVLVFLQSTKRDTAEPMQLPDFFRNIDAAFAFVFASGFSFGGPNFRVTGLGGGGGGNVFLKLPEKPEEVPKYEIIQMLRGTETAAEKTAKRVKKEQEKEAAALEAARQRAKEGLDPLPEVKKPERYKDANGEADELLEKLEAFGKILTPEPGAICIAFAATFKFLELFDCAALLVITVRDVGVEVALLGVAECFVGNTDASGKPDPEFAIGFIQLGLILRFSSMEGSVKLMGALTSASWIGHPDMRIRGGFALCVWFKGENAGDVMFSLGGYSPLVPKRPHYPALDRVALSWNPSRDLSVWGDGYLTIDTYGIQFGYGAGLRFATTAVQIDASFSLDVLIEWRPFFLEGRLRIGVHIETKAILTIRLGLDVDMHFWGPPFGARIEVRLNLWLSKPCFRVTLPDDSASPEKARARSTPTLDDVLSDAVKALASSAAPAAPATDPDSVAFAAPGGEAATKTDVLRLALVRAPLPTATKAGPAKDAHLRCRADELKIELSSAVPAQKVFIGTGANLKEQASLATKDPIDIGPLRKANIDSRFVIEEISGLDVAGWTVAPLTEKIQPRFWYSPAKKEQKWEDPKRSALRGVELSPPATRRGQELPEVGTARLGKVEQRTAPVKHEAFAAPAKIDRAGLLALLDAARFDLEGCGGANKTAA